MYNQTLVDLLENADLNYNVDKRVYDGRWRNPGDVKPYKALNYAYVQKPGTNEYEQKQIKTQATSRFVQDRKELTLSSCLLYTSFLFEVGCFIPATLMAKVEKVTLKGVIKGLGNEELILMNVDQSEITRTKTKNDRFEITAEVDTGDLRYYMLYAPSVGPLGPSMSIPTIFFFIDSPKITIEAELKNEQIKVKSLKGSPGRKESDRIMASLPSASKIQEIYDNYNKAFHEYNDVNQTPENMETLKAASRALAALEKQRRDEIFGLLPLYTTSMPVSYTHLFPCHLISQQAYLIV